MRSMVGMGLAVVVGMALKRPRNGLMRTLESFLDVEERVRDRKKKRQQSCHLPVLSSP